MANDNPTDVMSPEDFANEMPAADMPPAAPGAAPASTALSLGDFENEPPTAAPHRTWGDTGLAALAALGRGAELAGSGIVRGALGLPDLAVQAVNNTPPALLRVPTPDLPSLMVAAASGQLSPPPTAAPPLQIPTTPGELAAPYLAQPKNLGERLIYGAGVGLGSAALPGFAAGALLPERAAAALVPSLRGSAVAAGAGAGSEAAQDVTAKATSNPYLQAAAGLGGGVAGGLATGGALAVPRALAQIVRARTAAGQQTLAGELLRGATNMAPEDIAAAATQPTPAGIAPTLGDLTGDQGLQSLQRAVEARDLVAGGRAQTIASGNNQAILDAFDAVGQPGNRSPYEISQTAAQRLEQIRQQQQAAASGAFEAVPSKAAMVPIAPLQQRYNAYVSGLSQVRQRFLPDLYGDLLDRYGEAQPLSELQDFRSALQTDARQAASGANPDYNRANVLNGLHDALFPEGGPEDLLAPQQGSIGDQLRAARDQWRAYAQTYSEPPAIRAVLRSDGTPDSAAFDKLLGPAGGGQAERAGEFVAAAQGDPTLLQHARDWFAAKMQQAGSTASQDLQGSPMLSGNLLNRFVRANQPLVDSDIFTDQHRQAIGDILDAANMVQSTARAGVRGGSDTYRNLATGEYLGGLGLSPLARTIAGAAPRVIGGGVGGTIGGVVAGPTGGTVGGLVGTHVGENLMNLGRARGGVLDLVGQAVHDPELAAALMQRAPAGAAPAAEVSAQTLAPAGFWANVPGVARRRLAAMLASPTSWGTLGAVSYPPPSQP